MQRQLSVSRKLPFGEENVEPMVKLEQGANGSGVPAEDAAVASKKRRRQQPTKASLPDTQQLLSSLGDAVAPTTAGPAAGNADTAAADSVTAPPASKRRACKKKASDAPAAAAEANTEDAAAAQPVTTAADTAPSPAPAPKKRSRAKKQPAAAADTAAVAADGIAADGSAAGGAAADEATPAKPKPKPRRRGKAATAAAEAAAALGSPGSAEDALLASPSLAAVAGSEQAEAGSEEALAAGGKAPKVKKVRRTKKVIAEEVRAEAMQGIFNGVTLLTGSHSHITLLGDGTCIPRSSQQEQQDKQGQSTEAAGAAAAPLATDSTGAKAVAVPACESVQALVDSAAAVAGVPGASVKQEELLAHAPPAVAAPVQSSGLVQRLSVYQLPSGGPLLPNLGYACLNQTLREFDIFNSRDCIKKTFESGGLEGVGALALANARDLDSLLLWNEAHGIRLFRLSSCIFPWMTFYAMEDLPQWPDIQQALQQAGALATRLGHRLTFHPSEFCKIAGLREDWTAQSVKELEVHSRIFDEMQLLPASPYNKINIHVGGVYGDKLKTLQRFAKVVNERLSPNCRARLTVENDDRPSLFSTQDLMEVHRLCGIPIVFDFHHHKFLTGGLSEEEAFKLALSTWPQGVRPIVHWSESPEDENKPRHAHSAYVDGPIVLHGLEADVDVMIESKAKELALLHYREKAMGCSNNTTDVDDAREAAVALKRAASDKHRATVKAKAEKRKVERAKGKAGTTGDDSDDDSDTEQGEQPEVKLEAGTETVKTEDGVQRKSGRGRAAAAKRQKGPAGKKAPAAKKGKKKAKASSSESESMEEEDDSDYAG